MRRRAARRIVRAIERGEPHVAVGVPAKLAALANGVAPASVNRALTIANEMLPEGSDPRSRRGADSESTVAPSILTALNERAVVANLEWE